MASQAGLRGIINPSVPQSDTSHDSQSSERSTAIHPATHHLEDLDLDLDLDQDEQIISPQLPSLSIRSRTLSSASSTTSSPVRRKPVPSKASPLVTRYSSGAHLATTLELPEQSIIRSSPVDSPTLYDFPPTSANPYTPAARFSQQTLTQYVISLRKTSSFQYRSLI
jgi:hypothetical protein